MFVILVAIDEAIVCCLMMILAAIARLALLAHHLTLERVAIAAATQHIIASAQCVAALTVTCAALVATFADALERK